MRRKEGLVEANPWGSLGCHCPGTVRDLRGPVQFAGWWFGSDFVYGERPDVEVWLITLTSGSLHAPLTK